MCLFSLYTPQFSPNQIIKKYSNKDSNEVSQPCRLRWNDSIFGVNIGKILDKIDALNLSENTLIIFTSDNGGIRAISKPISFKGR